ncbi:MAG TPA: DUF192 domain-containing protein [Bacillales bacterium]|nr:DUF192 domain-containing protein [Bacillales bacterium]
MKLLNVNNGQLLAENVRLARRFKDRLLGLMFTKCLPPGQALLLQPCRSIHTFFMNYSIDVLYLDSANRVAAVNENLRPGKLGKGLKNALAVVELPSGTISATKTEVGQTVRFESKKGSDLHVKEN